MFVAHRRHVFGDPDPASVFPKDLRFETNDLSLLFHQLFIFFPPSRFNIELSVEIVDTGPQVFNRVVSQYARRGRVGGDVSSFGRRLCDGLHRVLEDVAVFFLGFAQGFLRPLALGDVANVTLNHARAAYGVHIADKFHFNPLSTA